MSVRPRRVLLLARHFPPIGGAGVHRSLGSVRHLPAHGLDPVVVTGPADREDRWSPRDQTMLGQIPAGTEVHRIAGPEPAGSTGWRARAERVTNAPSPWVRWWVRRVIEEGERVGRDADLILASCVPYETANAAAVLSRRLGVPWVADLEDPWALDEMRVQPTALSQALDLRAMRRALSTAAAVIMCAPEAARRVRAALPGLAGRPVVSIPIGFDRDAFGAEPAPRGDSAFRIVHTGSLHTELGERHRATRRLRRLARGTSVDVDILTRSPVFLLEALARLGATDPRLGTGVEVHLAGPLTAADRAAADRSSATVVAPGPLSHDATVALMKSADLLFLPMQDLPPGDRAGLVPYKTYEYLAAERPILAAVPDGDVRDLLADVRHATLTRPSDVEAMARAIRGWADRAPVGAVEDGVGSPVLAPLERRRCVARIAGVLRGVLGDAPTIV